MSAPKFQTPNELGSQSQPSQYRRPERAGSIGSEEGKDPMRPAAQRIDTAVARGNFEENRAPEMHGCGPMPQLVRYREDAPRYAPMPKAGQDEQILRLGVADPEMIDGDGAVRDRNDLFGRNVTGMAHNDNHPGFKAVQGKIEKEGYSKAAAGRILGKRTREASAAAKKKNPRLKRVKG